MRSFFSFLLLTCLTSCFLSTWDARLILINNTGQRVRYFNEIKDKDDFIPDTTYCNSGELYWLNPYHKHALLTHNKWEYSLKEHPDKILRIYIIHEDSLSKYGTCKIFKQQIFIKRFDLTYDDLERLDWKVIYRSN